MKAKNEFHLSDLAAPQRLVISLTLIVLGIGYLIATYNLYLTYALTDGQPGLTVSDLRRAFYGHRDSTKIAAKINGGSMSQFLPVPGDREKMLTWIQDGATPEGFSSTVKPIIDANCVRCHNPNGLQRFVPFTSYEEVMTVTQIDRGEPVSLWARVAHTHIQSIGLIFLVLGGVFSYTRLAAGPKMIILALPFLLLLCDFGARFLAKYWPEVIYLMLLSGAGIGILFAVMIFYPLYDMWLHRS